MEPSHWDGSTEVKVVHSITDNFGVHRQNGFSWHWTKSTMTERATAWSLTINNPTPADDEAIELVRQKGWKVKGQLEKGESGTLHYQLLVQTPQVRFSAVKKAFPRAHIEPARNVAALASYVTKEETRESALPTGQDKYPSLSKYWELVSVRLNANRPEWDWDNKDGLDVNIAQADRRASFYSSSKDSNAARDPLKLLDEVTADLIAEGYHVESIGINPSVRAAWRKWWRSIVFRAIETDRQTDMRSESAEVNLPMVHNHADDPTHPETARRILEGLHRPPHEGLSHDESRAVVSPQSPQGSGEDSEDGDGSEHGDSVHSGQSGGKLAGNLRRHHPHGGCDTNL